MKNKLGIEVKCENCLYYFMNDIGKVWCDKEFETRCKKENLILFRPRIAKLEARIKELQEQQFSEKELNSLQVALILAKDEFNFTPADNLLKKIEQTLKNLEGNLNKQ